MQGKGRYWWWRLLVKGVNLEGMVSKGSVTRQACITTGCRGSAVGGGVEPCGELMLSQSKVLQGTIQQNLPEGTVHKCRGNSRI